VIDGVDWAAWLAAHVVRTLVHEFYTKLG